MEFTGEQVQQILLMPIQVVKKKEPCIEIYLQEQKIVTTQRYAGNDPDVSDIALDFYETIYGINLISGRKLRDKQFCGDTMMAFNSLKGRAGFKGYQRLKDESHCLANFWVLPMDVGHSSPWTARRGLMYLSKSAKCKDDMGEFLQFAQCNTEAFQKVYPGYTNRLGMREESWDRFLDRHFIAGIDYAIHDPSMFQNALRKRAESIAACEKTREGLAELFQSENYRMIP